MGLSSLASWGLLQITGLCRSICKRVQGNKSQAPYTYVYTCITQNVYIYIYMCNGMLHTLHRYVMCYAFSSGEELYNSKEYRPAGQFALRLPVPCKMAMFPCISISIKTRKHPQKPSPKSTIVVQPQLVMLWSWQTSNMVLESYGRQGFVRLVPNVGVIPPGGP